MQYMDTSLNLKDIYEIYGDNGKLLLKCSGDHPVYIPRTGKYVQAKYIKLPADILGHKINDYEFSVSDIRDIKVIKDADLIVYDFTTVSDNHNFIANGIVVSNCVETPEHAKSRFD